MIFVEKNCFCYNSVSVNVEQENSSMNILEQPDVTVTLRKYALKLYLQILKLNKNVEKSEEFNNRVHVFLCFF